MASPADHSMCAVRLRLRVAPADGAGNGSLGFSVVRMPMVAIQMRAHVPMMAKDQVGVTSQVSGSGRTILSPNRDQA